MKFSFQTVCILFLVTLIHLVVISVFSSMTGTSSTILTDLKADALLEEFVLQASTDSAEQKSEQESRKTNSNLESSLPDNPIQTSGQESSQQSAEDGTSPKENGVATKEAEHDDVPAIADARFLSGRISRPDLEHYRAQPEESKGKSGDDANKARVVERPSVSRAEPINEPTAKAVKQDRAPQVAGSRAVRSIRPIPRS